MKQRGFAVLAYGLIALGIIATVTGFVWGGYAKGKAQGRAEVQAAWDDANAKARAAEAAKGNKAATGLEADRGKTRVVYKTITQTVDRYIDRPVYRNVCLDADGLRDANRALLGQGADPGQPDRPVPSPDPAR